MTLQLVCTRGLPASGKTTWAREGVANDPARRVRVSRDDFRAMLYDANGARYSAYFQDPTLYVREAAVTAAQRETVRGLLEDGRSVVVDNTNLRIRYLRQWTEMAYGCGAAFRVQDFMDVPVEECVRRDLERGGKVGEQVIRDMYAKTRSMPDVMDELDEVSFPEPFEQNFDGWPAYIVDIDGTVALMNGRSPYDYSRVSEDIPNAPVVALVLALARSGAQILFVSGRDAACRTDTVGWLLRYFPTEYINWGLFMRAEGDTRDDAVVKAEILERDIAPRFHVLGVLDDRNRVVRMWRRKGLLCLQVAPGAF